MATHSSISCVENSVDRSWQATVHEIAESDTTEAVCTHARAHTHTHTHRRYQDSDIKQRDLYSHSWHNYTQNNWTHFVFLPFCFLWKWGYSFTWPQNSACSLPPITTLNSDPCCLPFMSTAFTDIFNCPDVSAASLLFQLSKPT